MHALLPVRTRQDILPAYRETPIGDLLANHNLRVPSPSYDRAQLIVGMCMDHRYALCLPDNFAYILRTGGVNLKRIEFKVSYAIAVGGVQHLCLIGHDNCGMVDLSSRRDLFVRGLVKFGGWTAQAAEEHFDQHAAEFEIGDVQTFTIAEARRIGLRYPRLVVAPLFYQIEEGMLYQLVEEEHKTSRRQLSRSAAVR
ncbi:MAG: carbonic anhydrase [candidate division Zixibacteria bacterium]|nr:carbonic anhydrase [candidate division Zixibacteria bacterium]